MRRWDAGVMLVAGSLLACGSDASPEADSAAGECRVVQPATPLPPEMRESSGIAASQRQPGIFWTHNDGGGGPELFALDTAGMLVGRTAVAGAANQDWEDVAVGPCRSGTCVYVADIGDNQQTRPFVDVYRFPEPLPGSGVAANTDRFRLRYPDGAHNAEALFALPSGALYLITKTRGAAGVYALPVPLASGTLRHIRDLEFGSTGPEPVTGAAASPNGRWIAFRGNASLAVFHTSDLFRSAAPQPRWTDLRSLGEAQGEGVALLDDGRVALTSEGGSKQTGATLARLACSLGSPPEPRSPR